MEIGNAVTLHGLFFFFASSYYRNDPVLEFRADPAWY
jgi:hypothetical protein